MGNKQGMGFQLSHSQADKILIKLADEYRVTLYLDCSDTDDNEGASTGGEKPMVFLGRFDDNSIKICAFFHEIGHVVLSRMLNQVKQPYVMSKISHEGAAWELGRIEAAKHGFHYDYNHECMKWARGRLATYMNAQNLKELGLE